MLVNSYDLAYLIDGNNPKLVESVGDVPIIQEEISSDYVATVDFSPILDERRFDCSHSEKLLAKSTMSSVDGSPRSRYLPKHELTKW